MNWFRELINGAIEQMNATEFRDLVRQMRGYQREYFKTRDSSVLDRAKEAERCVDRVLESDGQRTLFDPVADADARFNAKDLPF